MLVGPNVPGWNPEIISLWGGAKRGVTGGWAVCFVSLVFFVHEVKCFWPDTDTGLQLSEFLNAHVFESLFMCSRYSFARARTCARVQSPHSFIPGEKLIELQLKCWSRTHTRKCHLYIKIFLETTSTACRGQIWFDSLLYHPLSARVGWL